MKKLLIFGSNGLLGQNLVRKFSDHFEILCSSSEENSFIPNYKSFYQKVDFTNRKATRNLIDELNPDIIINSAAYTDVDACEKNAELCWNTNAKALEYIIEGAQRSDSLLVQISTDYVFDGTDAPYSENDKPNPNGNYARSKMAAENLVRSSELEYIIIRTQILYGTGTKLRLNFVTWVLDQLRKKNKIRVVDDQIGNPTYAPDLSEALFRLLEKQAYGLYHVSSPDSLSRYDFAINIARIFELDENLIQRVSTSDLRQKAPRPQNSAFIINKLVNNTVWEPHTVEESLRLLKKELKD